jgi:N-acyl-D-amino-acid deacylase
MHTHSDRTLLIHPRAESLVKQGVTTRVTGNCGISSAPFAREAETDWHTVGEYLDRLAE